LRAIREARHALWPEKYWKKADYLAWATDEEIEDELKRRRREGSRA
jgi:hypothetical protein